MQGNEASFVEALIPAADGDVMCFASAVAARWTCSVPAYFPRRRISFGSDRDANI